MINLKDVFHNVEERLSYIKNYYCFTLLLDFGQLSGLDQILVNEFLRNADVTVSKYAR